MHLVERISDSIECYKILIDKIVSTKLEIERYYIGKKDCKMGEDANIGLLQHKNDRNFEYTAIYDSILYINPFPHEVYEMLISITHDLMYIDEVKLMLKNATHEVGLLALTKTYDCSLINQLIYEPRTTDSIEKIKHTIADINSKILDIPGKIEKNPLKFKCYDAFVNEIIFDISHCIYKIIKINNDDIIHMKISCDLILKNITAIDKSLINNEKNNNNAFYG